MYPSGSTRSLKTFFDVIIVQARFHYQYWLLDLAAGIDFPLPKLNECAIATDGGDGGN